MVALGEWSSDTIKLLDTQDLSVQLTVSLRGTAHARSVLLSPLGGLDHLVVGTGDGHVQIYNFHGGPGGPRVSGGRRVVVGNSAVSLKSFTYQPPGEVPRTAVLAHCPQSSCAVLYAELAKEAQEEARTTRDAVCVRAARLHGGERLVSISSVDTEALPGSGGAAFVWLGADHRLALGRVDSALRLRHVHARLNAHPTALAYHPGCRCAVALVDRTPRGKSASPRSSLQLHQIDNLCEVLSQTLPAGHVGCGVLCGPLHHTSADMRHASPWGASHAPLHPQPRKHFVIISSYVYGALQDAADPDSGGGTAARAVGVRGVLTVYEVQWRRKGETRDEFQLVLHGTCALRSVCHCLQWMPSPSCKGGADEDRVLLAGGHDALYMYSLRVDDGSTAGKGVVADALRVINSAATAPLPLLAAPEDDEEEVDSEGGKEEARSRATEERLRQRVHLELLGETRMPHRQAVSVLACTPTSLLGAEVFSSFAVVQAAQRVGTVSDDSPEAASGTCVAPAHGDAASGAHKPGPPSTALSLAAVDQSPILVQALHALSETLILVAAHPNTLLIMERQLSEEAHFIERERRRAQAAFERGGGAASTALPDGAPGGTGPNAPAADNAGGAEPLTANPQAAPGATPGPEDAAEPARASWADSAPALRIVGGCQPGHMIMHILWGRLGLPVRDLPVRDLPDEFAESPLTNLGNAPANLEQTSLEGSSEGDIGGPGGVPGLQPNDLDGNGKSDVAASAAVEERGLLLCGEAGEVIAGAWAAAHQMPGLVAAQRALQAVPQSAFVPDCMRLVQHAEHWNSSLCSYDELDDDREYLNGHGGSAGTDQRSRSANDLENDIATGVSSSLREPAASDLQPASKDIRATVWRCIDGDFVVRLGDHSCGVTLDGGPPGDSQDKQPTDSSQNLASIPEVLAYAQSTGWH
ncbi:hypothetical protein CYMTET_42092 [Cymbomonas tetramitiformis]|uniref:Uncharacterized protein n=1 Tax=Cymbomonas tetramitiformis TaxID=36881 RepID=A0AAE0C4S6_9CHLO|nr:hypothetical protein CYMTET_42092 [Cymbomonas tetramitiformis]